MADDVRRWSDELARDPNSLVFLELGETLRRQRLLDVAHKIALRGVERHPRNADAHDLIARIAVDRGDLPTARERWTTVLQLVPGHAGALKGMGYLSFQEGRLAEAERYLSHVAATDGDGRVTSALATVRRTSMSLPAVPDPASGAPATDAARETLPQDPRCLFADLLVEDAQTALLLDAGGYVLGGIYLDTNGTDVSSDVGAQLSGITDEIRRAMRHLDIGEWHSITFETQVAVVSMAPSADESLVVVAASRATPLGLVRRLLERCGRRASAWLERGSGE
ncbi:MAG TPA: tetratricopeptide repeat protein [Gemmatimonadaceae bacterium]|jgi:tetratricopeptide (TPR) repeat protein|nr:tetratricopeptide repeat protein [Gemmatimonadaceae bacterium]